MVLQYAWNGVLRVSFIGRHDVHIAQYAIIV